MGKNNKQNKKNRTNRLNQKIQNAKNSNSGQTALVKNNSGTIKDSATMMRATRYGETTEKSQLWDALLQNIDNKNEKHYYISCVIMPDGEFSSHTLNGQTEEISTTFDLINDNEYKTEIAFVHDEICRMISEGKECVLTLRAFTDTVFNNSNGEPFTYPSGMPVKKKEIRTWLINEKNTLFGISEAELFNAHHIDHATGEPIAGELGADYLGTETIIINHK